MVTMGDTGKSARRELQVFAKASQFGSFLKETVGELPTPDVETTDDPSIFGDAARFPVSLLSFAVPILSMLLVSGL